MSRYPEDFITTRHHALYCCWQQLHIRCRPDSARYKKRYFDRGITVCLEWAYWPTFARWALENGYKKGLEIDRQDNDLGYGPDNCRFVTHDVQNANRDLKMAHAGIKRAHIAKHAKEFVCVETGRKYLTQIEAHKDTGIDRKSLRNALSGKYSQAGGFHWEYTGRTINKEGPQVIAV